jgi:hypothetical protein
MMSNLSKYYISRTLIALAFGALALILSGSWPLAIGMALGALAIFLYLPKSGRYIIRSENSVTPFRIDEYSQTIRNQAARDGFVVMTLGFFVLQIYSMATKTSLTANNFTLLFVFGWLTYLVSDFWRRRA